MEKALLGSWRSVALWCSLAPILLIGCAGSQPPAASDQGVNRATQSNRETQLQVRELKATVSLEGNIVQVALVADGLCRDPNLDRQQKTRSALLPEKALKQVLADTALAVFIKAPAS